MRIIVIKVVVLLMLASSLQAMQVESVKLAESLSMRLFDTKNEDLVSAFSHILRKDKRTSPELFIMRHKMLGVLRETKVKEEKCTKQSH